MGVSYLKVFKTVLIFKKEQGHKFRNHYAWISAKNCTRWKCENFYLLKLLKIMKALKEPGVTNLETGYTSMTKFTICQISKMKHRDVTQGGFEKKTIRLKRSFWNRSYISLNASN